jgi:hypothetical protein
LLLALNSSVPSKLSYLKISNFLSITTTISIYGSVVEFTTSFQMAALTIELQSLNCVNKDVAMVAANYLSATT